MVGNEGTGMEWGNRIYLSYSGSAPTAANCATLASDVASAWASHISPLVNPSQALEEVDVLDIATLSGLSGQWTGTNAGSEGSGTNLPVQCASNIEFNIERRYRGGKPRIYLPPPSSGVQVSAAKWTNTFVTDLNNGFGAFITELNGLSIGAMGTLAHVNVSYYQGYTNVEIPGSRAYAQPKYRDIALIDSIVGYSAKAEISSQRRRRTATTP